MSKPARWFRGEIIEAVWGQAAQGVTEQALDALVRRLRDRLAEIDTATEYIVTVADTGCVWTILGRG